MDLLLRTKALALGRCFLIVLVQAHDTIAQEQQRKSDQQRKFTAPKVCPPCWRMHRAKDTLALLWLLCQVGSTTLGAGAGAAWLLKHIFL